MKNIVLKITYDGAPYYGWQIASAGPSVEQVLKDTLERILKQPVELQAASRTDRGVHAEEQIVNFFISRELNLFRLQGSLNALLPSSIRVLKAQEAPLTFHPTVSALKKVYAYSICRGLIQLPSKRFFSWHVPHQLNLEAMEEGGKKLIGTHNFASFCTRSAAPKQVSPICQLMNIRIQTSCEKHLSIEIEGDRFLYKMARTVVGTLVYIGRGKISSSEIPSILERRTRTLAGVTAPAHGLFLKKVYYPQEYAI